MKVLTWRLRSDRRLAERRAGPGARRDRLAWLAANVTLAGLALIFVLSAGPTFLMPGPLSSAHSTISSCRSCHSQSGSGPVGWIAGLRPGPPHGDSKACLTCHTMPETALNAHGASEAVLKRSTERLIKLAARTSRPLESQLQNAAFPTAGLMAEGVACATCHQEHQGAAFDLTAVTDDRCRACHSVPFDRFDGGHPEFEGYPFVRRTRLIYDHAGHFGKHYPELVKKDKASLVPATCSTCHDSRRDARVMAVAPFEKTCSACHLDQITGKERASGPKGVAFLSIPGVDVATLKKKRAVIGEWPEDSEAALSPFMKVMLARSDRGAALLDRLEGVNLMDLSAARDDQIDGVAQLIWEIKRLLHGLLSDRVTEVLADLRIGGGNRLTAGQIADLTANLPRDVIVAAQQRWLPNLSKEMDGRPAPSGERPRSDVHEMMDGRDPIRLASAAPLSLTQVPEMSARLGGSGGRHVPVRSRPLGWAARTDLAQLAEGGADEDHGETTLKRRSLPSGTPRSIEGLDKEPASPPRDRSPDTAKADEAAALPAGPAADVAPASGAAAESPPDAASSGAQTDDLLSPTPAELREIKERDKGRPSAGTAGFSSAPAGVPVPAPSATGGPDPAAPSSAAAPATAPSSPATAERAGELAGANDSEIDAESWAETGGWYQQDHAIFYRPTGHKDKFLYTWLTLTASAAGKGATGSAATVFHALTGKDAQGICTKCHSVDDRPGAGLTVNFTPQRAVNKAGRFTMFRHDPHLGSTPSRGCLTCHELDTGRSVLKSYEQGDPLTFVSGFRSVAKDTCQTCHADNKARQDCQLCHAYHVNGVSTPIPQTRILTPDRAP